jgi:hypothetical protein
MAGTIISRILSAIEKGIEEKGSFIVVNGAKHEIKKENFQPVTDLCRAKTVFIDGGNAELLSAPNFSLQFVRVTAVAYENGKRAGNEKMEFYALASAKSLGERIVYDIQTFGNDISFGSVDSEDETLKTGKHRASASSAVELCRRLAEIRMAKKMSAEAGKGIIVIDGSLEATKTGEKQELDMLFRKAKENDTSVVGLSKTTRLMTEKGNSAAAVLGGMAPEGEWVYSIGGGVYAAKLNKNSKHVFRIDISNGRIANAASALKQNSRDPVFLGYPYGLIDADRLARISNNEAEHLRMMFIAKAGKNFEKIKAHLNSLNAHSILDSIS